MIHRKLTKLAPTNTVPTNMYPIAVLSNERSLSKELEYLYDHSLIKLVPLWIPIIECVSDKRNFLIPVCPSTGDARDWILYNFIYLFALKQHHIPPVHDNNPSIDIFNLR